MGFEENKLDQFLAQYKLPLAIGFVGLVLFIGGMFSSGVLGKIFVKSTKSPITVSSASVAAATTKVDVSGEVRSPGVYNVSSSARVEDALNAAGGVTESADPQFISKNLNLAQKVADGMKIYIPKVAEAGPSGVISGSEPAVAGTQTVLVNINIASQSELEKLSKVGPVTAQKIIDKRPYSSIEELYTKKAVNKSVYEEIKDKVNVY